MTATHVNIRNRKVISNMSYFGMFNHKFVHFHLYATHEAVYDCDIFKFLFKALLFNDIF